MPTLSTITYESYPTHLRAKACGFVYTFAYILSGILNMFIISLKEISIYTPFILLIGDTVLGIIALICLPKDKASESLESD